MKLHHVRKLKEKILIKNKFILVFAISFILLGCRSSDSPFEATIDPGTPTIAQEADELGEESYEEVYDYYEQVFDELITEFHEEALDPDVFFAEYGVSSVYEEKLMEMENERLKAQDELDDIFQNGLGNEADLEIWTTEMSELFIQKVFELDEAHKVMLAY